VTVLVAASLAEALVGVVAAVLSGGRRHALVMTCSLFPLGVLQSLQMQPLHHGVHSTTEGHLGVQPTGRRGRGAWRAVVSSLADAKSSRWVTLRALVG
jgi:hypothetical protein